MALKQDGAHLVLCISLCGATLSTQKKILEKQGNNPEGVGLNRACILGFLPAHLHPNIK